MVANVMTAPGGPKLRLETLIALRWLAVLGQTVAVFIVAVAFGYNFHLPLCLALIAISAWLNVFLKLRFRTSLLLPDSASMALLAYDTLQLSALLFLTGGLQNPFSVLLVVPVVVSAATQSPRQILPLGLLAATSATFLVFVHLPLPWHGSHTFALPLVYVLGMWGAIIATLVFTSMYAFRVANESRRLSEALAATELVLQREQHLSTLDGLAAAAAHELGTPLSTIALVSKEMMRELDPDSPLMEDARLLRSQAERCRGILQKLTSLSEEGDSHIGRLPLSSLMEEVAAPHREFGIKLSVEPGAKAGEPVYARNAAILYGLGNLVENATEFARSQVRFAADWDDGSVTISITDDGPGFPADLLDRVGEPYLTNRRRGETGGGLGLGLFIAKTLLERAGAAVDFANASPAGSGAIVTVRWPRKPMDLAMSEPARQEQPTPQGELAANAG